MVPRNRHRHSCRTTTIIVVGGRLLKTRCVGTRLALVTARVFPISPFLTATKSWIVGCVPASHALTGNRGLCLQTCRCHGPALDCHSLLRLVLSPEAAAAAAAAAAQSVGLGGDLDRSDDESSGEDLRFRVCSGCESATRVRLLRAGQEAQGGRMSCVTAKSHQVRIFHWNSSW